MGLVPVGTHIFSLSHTCVMLISSLFRDNSLVSMNKNFWQTADNKIIFRFCKAVMFLSYVTGWMGVYSQTKYVGQTTAVCQSHYQAYERSFPV